jgi:branched-chain amino acid transport system substrate-binding protein
MKKRHLLGGLIAVLLVVALTAMACGGGATTTTAAPATTVTTAAPSTETTTAPATTASTPASTTATSAAGPATGEPIKIGVISSLTGFSSGPGVDESKGIKYEVGVVNANGGINGRPLQIVEYDDQSNVEPGTAAATKLIQDDKVFAIIGPFVQYGQGPVRAIEEQAKIVGVVPGCPTLKEQSDSTKLTWSVSNAQDSNIQAAGAINLIKDMGYKSIVGIGDVLPMHQDNLDLIAAGADANGYKFDRMPDTVTFDQSDFQPIINRIKEEVQKVNADALNLQFTPYIVGPVSAGLRALGINLPTFCSSAAVHPSFFQTAGPQSVEGIYVLDNAGDANPEQLPDSYPLKQQQVEFKNGYKQANGADPTVYAAMGAGEVIVLATAMRQAKDASDEESVREALVNLTNVSAIEGIVTFTPDSTDVGMKNPPVLFQAKNGVFQFIKVME